MFKGRFKKSEPIDLLVVGLANPGGEFEGTRHNVGAMVVECLAEREGLKLRAGKESARIAEMVARGDADEAPPRLALAVPTSYMNESGEPVARLLRRFDIESPGLLVIHDDLDLPLAKIRVKDGGGTGGHRGLESIVKRLGTKGFLRIRIGIGRPPGSMEPADFVLRQFRKRERDEIDPAIEEAADAVIDVATIGIEAAMNEYN